MGSAAPVAAQTRNVHAMEVTLALVQELRSSTFRIRAKCMMMTELPQHTPLTYAAPATVSDNCQL